MHIEMLSKSGIRLIENVYLEEIVREKVYEFCVIGAPMRFKGGTGSPIRLLAMVCCSVREVSIALPHARMACVDAPLMQAFSLDGWGMRSGAVVCPASVVRRIGCRGPVWRCADRVQNRPFV